MFATVAYAPDPGALPPSRRVEQRTTIACDLAGLAKFAEELLVLTMPGVLKFSTLSNAAKQVADKDPERHERHDTKHKVILRLGPACASRDRWPPMHR